MVRIRPEPIGSSTHLRTESPAEATGLVGASIMTAVSSEMSVFEKDLPGGNRRVHKDSEIVMRLEDVRDEDGEWGST